MESSRSPYWEKLASAEEVSTGTTRSGVAGEGFCVAFSAKGSVSLFSRAGRCIFGIFNLFVAPESFQFQCNTTLTSDSQQDMATLGNCYLECCRFSYFDSFFVIVFCREEYMNCLLDT